jgi:hypothetical protein
MRATAIEGCYASDFCRSTLGGLKSASGRYAEVYIEPYA